MDAEILVVDPSSGLPSRSDLQDYERLLNTLIEEHLDFLMVDTDILESGEIKDGRVHIKDIAAKVVILPHMRVVEDPLESWLGMFQESGGIVIRLEESFKNEHLRSLESVRPPLRIHAVQGNAKRLQMVTRKDKDRTIWFFVNTGAEKLDVKINSDRQLHEIPLDDDLPTMLTKIGETHRRIVHPFQSFLIEAAEEPSTDSMPEKVVIPVNPPSEIVPRNKNLLRMYDWEMELLDEEGQALQSAVVPAIPLPNQLAHGKFRFAPTTNISFGSTPKLALPMLDISTRAD